MNVCVYSHTFFLYIQNCSKLEGYLRKQNRKKKKSLHCGAYFPGRVTENRAEIVDVKKMKAMEEDKGWGKERVKNSVK